MLERLRRKLPARTGGTVRVGWFTMADEAGFIWLPPRQAARHKEDPRSPKSVLNCPAVVDFEARIIEVPCPVDIHLRFTRDKDGKPMLANGAGPRSAITKQKLNKLVTLAAPGQWRHQDRPVLQLSTPYRFISDDYVYMNQLPPYHHFRDDALPGTMICGRFPIDAWPRPMMWAFEWHRPDRDLILRRGEPWFTLRFETSDPKAHIRLVEAEVTPELERFCKGVDGVTNYVNRTFSLFDNARARRPKRLLVERR